MSKKDINYVAAVEKSIAEKYGKETVQDFRSNWDPEKEKDYIRELSTRGKKKTNKKNSDEEIFALPYFSHPVGVCTSS